MSHHPYGSRAGGAGRSSHGGSRAGFEDMRDAMSDMELNSHGRRTGGGGMSSHGSHSERLRGWRDIISLMDEWECNPRKPRQRKRDLATLRNDQRTFHAAMRALPNGNRGTLDEQEEVMVRKRTLEEDIGQAESDAGGKKGGINSMRMKYGEGFSALGSMPHGSEQDIATLEDALHQTRERLQGMDDASSEAYRRECTRILILQQDIHMLQDRIDSQGMETEDAYMSSSSRPRRAVNRRVRVPHGMGAPTRRGGLEDYDDEESDYQSRGSRHGHCQPPPRHPMGY